MKAEVFIYFADSPVNVTEYVSSVNVRRGRSRELDKFPSGTCSVVLNNEERVFDPLNRDGIFFGLIRPRLRVAVTRDNISLFDGVIEDWNFNYDLSNKSNASIDCVDGLALLSQTDMASFVNTQDSPDERIRKILARTDVDYPGATNLDPGLVTLQGDTVAENTNTISYLQIVSDTDLGRLFVDGAGVLRYRNRTTGIIELPRVIFGSVEDPYIQQLSILSNAVLWFDASSPEPLRIDSDAVAQTILQDSVLWFDASDPDYVAPVIGFSGIDVEFGSEFLFNRVSVQRKSGSTVIVTDTVSKDVYKIRALTLTDYLFLDDEESLAYASYLLTLYSDPDVRVASLTLNVHGMSVLHRRYMERLEIGDVVRTIWTPNNVGEAFDRDSIIEGVEHTITPTAHVMRLQLTPFSRAGFILDDLNRGLLDTSELTY